MPDQPPGLPLIRDAVLDHVAVGVRDLARAAVLFRDVLGGEFLYGADVVPQAFRLAPTAYVSPILYSQIVWGTLIGALVFGEAVEFHVLVGAAMVAASGIALAVWASPRRLLRATPPS